MIYVTIVILYLLYQRTKSMSYILDEEKYMAKQKENLDKIENSLKDIKVLGNDYCNTIIKISIIICGLIEAFMIMFYFLLGVELGNPIFAILSTLEVSSCIISFKIQVIDEKMFEFDFKNVRYHKYMIMFNAGLDYIYYLMALYLLWSK